MRDENGLLMKDSCFGRSSFLLKKPSADSGRMVYLYNHKSISMASYREAGFVRKFLSELIDAFLCLATTSIFIFAMNMVSPGWELQSWVMPLLIFFFITYRFLSILLFDQTAGMKFFALVLLNGEEAPPHLKEKIAFAFFILLHGTAYYRLN